MRIVQEEVFGFVLIVEIFSFEKEVIVFVNDIIYGLVGVVWLKDIEKCECVVVCLRMGIVWINDFYLYFVQVLWGGYK